MKTSGPIRIALFTLSVIIIWIAFEHVMGYNTNRHDIGQYTRMVAMFMFWISLFIVVRNEKRKHGNITFLQGWKAGLVVSLVFGLGFALIIFLYQQFVNPEFYETLKIFTQEELARNEATQIEIDAKMKELEMSYNSGALSFVLLFVFSFIWGAVISAIAALVFKSGKST